jgi:hypothetical protein
MFPKQISGTSPKILQMDDFTAESIDVTFKLVVMKATATSIEESHEAAF